MQHHSPNTDEQPSSFAELTIVELPLYPDGPADEEQPSPMAECTIEIVPLNPLDVVAELVRQTTGPSS
jgi:hypothetical protein